MVDERMGTRTGQTLAYLADTNGERRSCTLEETVNEIDTILTGNKQDGHSCTAYTLHKH